MFSTKMGNGHDFLFKKPLYFQENHSTRCLPFAGLGKTAVHNPPYTCIYNIAAEHGVFYQRYILSHGLKRLKTIDLGASH